jgi:HK97 gp10 family phage protein
MATNVTSVKLDTRLLDKLTAETKPKARVIVNQYGLEMTNEAARTAPRDVNRPPINLLPLNTGALRNSITSESGMTGDLTFTLSDGVEYGVYQEFGTSVIPARPFMLPAVEKYTQAFLNAFNGLFKV